MTEKPEGSYYIVIPGRVKGDPRLSSDAKLLYGEVAAKCNLKGFCWASNKFFSEVFGCNLRSVQRYMKELEDAGHISVEIIKDGNGTRRNVYLTDAKILASNLSPSGMTELTPPQDIPNTPPHDNDATHINLSNLLFKENKNSFAKAKGGDKKRKTVKKEKPAKPKTLLATFLDIYNSWFKKENEDAAPKIDGAAVNAGKSIVEYLRKVIKGKAEAAKKELSDAEVEAEILNAWELILNRWRQLEPFLQAKTRLLDINSRIQDILIQIKNKNQANGSTNRQQHSGNSKTAGASELAASLEQDKNEIRQRFNTPGSWDFGE